MSQFKPEKCHVTFGQWPDEPTPMVPRCYTLTHSDRTGDLFLTIAPTYDKEQISGWYTRLMRDEVLGNWEYEDEPTLHLHCQVSGGFVLGPAKWRDAIFQQHLPLVLEAICFGDRKFLLEADNFRLAEIFVHFHAMQDSLNREENWGIVQNYLPSKIS